MWVGVCTSRMYAPGSVSTLVHMCYANVVQPCVCMCTGVDELPRVRRSFVLVSLCLCRWVSGTIPTDVCSHGRVYVHGCGGKYTCVQVVCMCASSDNSFPLVIIRALVILCVRVFVCSWSLCMCTVCVSMCV